MIILALGSNLKSTFGDRIKTIEAAIIFLESYGIKLIKKSSFYETPAYPNKEDPNFINIVIEVESKLSPEDLASILLFIEKKLGRKRAKKNDPRTCDIDIIDFNNKVFDFYYKDLKFIIPHEKAKYRNFVLIPLEEISPNWLHPKSKETIRSLINKLSSDERKSILKIKKN